MHTTEGKAAPPAEAQISLDASSTARFLGVAAAVLVFANLVVLFFCQFFYGKSPHDVRWAQFFYLDGERNIPTAFSLFLLVTADALLATIATIEWGRRGFSIYWAVLAVGFACMAIDEAWSFHERLSAIVHPLIGNRSYGIWYYAWVFPALVLVAVLGMFFLRFLWRLPAATRVAFLVAGFVYVGGVVGIELIESLVDDVYTDRSLISGLVSTVQETMEMAGVILFIRALLVYLGGRHKRVCLQLD